MYYKYKFVKHLSDKKKRTIHSHKTVFIKEQLVKSKRNSFTTSLFYKLKNICSV